MKRNKDFTSLPFRLLAPGAVLLLICLQFTFSTAQQAPDFLHYFEMKKEVLGGITQPLDGKNSLTATEVQNDQAVVLSLTDDAGIIQWSYRYKFGSNALRVEPVAIRPASYGTGLKAVIVGTIYLPASEAENWWTSDFWMMEVDVATGNLSWIRVFGSEEKDLCAGFLNMKDVFLFVPPATIIKVPSYLVYGRSWDYDHSSPVHGQQDLLVVTTDYQGQTTGSQVYASPNPTQNQVRNHFPTDAVADNYEVIITGMLETRQYSGSNPYSFRELYTIHIDQSQLSNAVEYTHDAGVTVRTGRGVHIVYDTPGLAFWRHQALSFTTGDDEVGLVKLYERTASWGKTYRTSFDRAESAGMAYVPDGLAILVGENDKTGIYPDVTGLLRTDLSGSYQSYYRYIYGGFPVPASLEYWYWNDGLLIQTEPVPDDDLGGFSLIGTDTDGLLSAECYEADEIEETELEVASEEEGFDLPTPQIEETEWSVTRDWELGYASSCPEGGYYMFYGPEKTYGNYPVRMAQPGSAEAPAGPETGTVEWYPVPLADAATLRISLVAAHEGTLSLQLADVAGRIVYQASMSAHTGHNLFEIPADAVPSGISIATLTREGQVIARRKIVK